MRDDHGKNSVQRAPLGASLEPGEPWWSLAWRGSTRAFLCLHGTDALAPAAAMRHAWKRIRKSALWRRGLAPRRQNVERLLLSEFTPAAVWTPERTQVVRDVARCVGRSPHVRRSMVRARSALDRQRRPYLRAALATEVELRQDPLARGLDRRGLLDLADLVRDPLVLPMIRQTLIDLSDLAGQFRKTWGRLNRSVAAKRRAQNGPEGVCDGVQQMFYKDVQNPLRAFRGFARRRLDALSDTRDLGRQYDARKWVPPATTPGAGELRGPVGAGAHAGQAQHVLGLLPALIRDVAGAYRKSDPEVLERALWAFIHTRKTQAQVAVQHGISRRNLTRAYAELERRFRTLLGLKSDPAP